MVSGKRMNLHRVQCGESAQRSRMVMYSKKKLSGYRAKWFTDNQAVAEVTTYGSVMYSKKKLSGHRVKWFTDNQAVAEITTHGSMKIEL